jgi:hypothetical protein
MQPGDQVQVSQSVVVYKCAANAVRAKYRNAILH